MTSAASAAHGAIDRVPVLVASFGVLGQLPSMKNRRELRKNRKTGKLYPGKSDEALAYVELFILQVPAELKKLALGSEDRPLCATVSVWYASHRSDLDTALVYDCLQMAGVISNDRWIIEHHEYKHVDSKMPRVEIEISEL